MLLLARQTVASFNIIDDHGAAARERYRFLFVLLRFAAVAPEVPSGADIIYNGSRGAGAIALTLVQRNVLSARRVEHTGQSDLAKVFSFPASRFFLGVDGCAEQ